MNLTVSPASTAIGISTVSSVWNPYGEAYQIGFHISEDTVEIIYRQDCNIILTSNPPQYPPPKIYKHVYKIVDGKLILGACIEGRYIPAKPETYEFD